MHDMAMHLRNRHPAVPLIVVGTSRGGNLLLKYIGEYAGRHPFAAAYASSSAYNLGALHHHYMRDRFASSMLTLCMLTMLEERAECTEKLVAARNLGDTLQLRRLFRHSNIWELDRELVMPFYPGRFKDVEDFYAQNSCHAELERLDVPTLLLNARDDVLVAPGLIDYAVSAAEEKNPHVVSVVTRQGSHCGWMTGAGLDSWEIKLMCNFIDAVLDKDKFNV